MFAQWTRLKDDEDRVRCDTTQAEAPLKFITYAPDYLSSQSCASSSSCRVYEPPPSESSAEDDLRKRLLTNKRQNQRASTEELPAYGIRTAPHQASGPVREAWMPRPLHQSFARSCDLEAAAAPVTHHLDTSVMQTVPQMHRYADRLPGRRDVFVSSRVERRNAWADQCASSWRQAAQSAAPNGGACTDAA